MATIKAFSDLQQSKKLVEILPLESADMWYSIVDDEPFVCLERHYEYEQIPCWSLAALLGVLPNGIGLFKTVDGEFYCLSNDYMTNNYDSLIDACYELILKLNELNLL